LQQKKKEKGTDKLNRANYIKMVKAPSLLSGRIRLSRVSIERYSKFHCDSWGEIEGWVKNGTTISYRRTKYLLKKTEQGWCWLEPKQKWENRGGQ